MSDLKNATDAECREWVELGMEVAQQQNSGDPGCKCATCLVFVSLHDIVMGREAVAAREVKGRSPPEVKMTADDRYESGPGDCICGTEEIDNTCPEHGAGGRLREAMLRGAGPMPSAAHALCDTPMCVHPKGHRWRCADEDGRVCRPAGPSSSSALCPHCKGALP